ncbi:MAG TPA: hypothetical protein VIH08_14620, partial [Blastococcus sp.]
MPLRSVEAASRDDAIAAAREQFGPHTRIVGVRRVRSGGVLGFFATERYIAEVAEGGPDTAGRPAVPARGRADADLPPADFSSPLASAAPARARSTAPARNGAAAWAAEAAARSTDDDIPPAVRAAAAAARAAASGPSTAAPAAPTRGEAPARPAAQPAPARADDDRVSELVGLLGTQHAEPATPTYGRATFPRASFPRTGGASRLGDSLSDEDVRGGDQRVPATAQPATPSPFTAALARMVAGDKDVRQAVQVALAEPAEAHHRDDAEPWAVRSQPVRTADSSASPSAARQEEETVGDQVIVPPSTTDRPVEVPTWAAEPEVTAASVSPREEAIADLLRVALAQGHSDEALAGILRTVLAGASPQPAPAEPEPSAPVFAETTFAEPGPGEPVFAVPSEPVFAVPSEPVFAVPSEPVCAVPSEPVSPAPEVAVPESAQEVPAEPVLAGPDASAGERVATPVVEAAADIEGWAPITEAAPAPAPVVLSTTADPMWGTPSCSATLWGGSAPAVAAPATTADIPIRGEVMAKEPTSAPLVPTATITENPVVDARVVEAPVVVDAVAEEPVVEEVEDAGIAEGAPLLARTASDPAPLMSLDATTVMPPLSLLPPLPSSRGRGRPPVPPVAPRHTSSSAGRSSAAGPSAEATVAGADEDRASAPAATPSLSPDAAGPAVDAPAPDAPAPTTGSLATVTRLPVAPSRSGQDIPELSEHVDEQEAEDVVTAIPVPTAPSAPGEVGDGDLAAELERLGLPPELLGDTFADDVAARGAYAALTRSL